MCGGKRDFLMQLVNSERTALI